MCYVAYFECFFKLCQLNATNQEAISSPNTNIFNNSEQFLKIAELYVSCIVARCCKSKQVYKQLVRVEWDQN